MGLSRARPRSWGSGTAAIAATLLLLSGCGGSSSSSAPASSASTSQTSQKAGRFKAAIVPVLNEFKRASQATGVAIEHASSKSDAQLAATFRQLGTKWKSGL